MPSEVWRARRSRPSCPLGRRLAEPLRSGPPPPATEGVRDPDRTDPCLRLRDPVRRTDPARARRDARRFSGCSANKWKILENSK